MGFVRLVVITGNHVEKHSHWFDQSFASERDWYSLCGKVFDDMGNHSQTVAAISDKHIRVVHNIRKYPKLCSNCKKLRIMRELAE